MMCKCGNSIHPKRLELGYFTCLLCGEKEAQKEATRKARSAAPAYNKGAYQYVTSKQMAKDVGRK